MPLTLDVDGIRSESPSDADVAHAFESLNDGSGGGGSGISHMVLRKDATHWLAAFGTFAEGFSLSYQDGDSNYQFYAEQQGTPVAEVVRIFEAYARGEDWGQARFTWEPFILRDKTMTIVKRLLMIILLGYTAWAVIKLATR